MTPARVDNDAEFGGKKEVSDLRNTRTDEVEYARESGVRAIDLAGPGFLGGREWTSCGMVWFVYLLFVHVKCSSIPVL